MGVPLDKPYTAYIGEDSSIWGTWNVWWNIPLWMAGFCFLKVWPTTYWPPVFFSGNQTQPICAFCGTSCNPTAVPPLDDWITCQKAHATNVHQLEAFFKLSLVQIFQKKQLQVCLEKDTDAIRGRNIVFAHGERWEQQRSPERRIAPVVGWSKSRAFSSGFAGIFHWRGWCFLFFLTRTFFCGDVWNICLHFA